jgi:hypothetical protein
MKNKMYPLFFLLTASAVLVGSDSRELVPSSGARERGSSAPASFDLRRFDDEIMSLRENREARLAKYEGFAQAAIAERAMHSVVGGATAVGALGTRLAASESACLNLSAQMDGLKESFVESSAACRTTQELFIAEKARLEQIVERLRERQHTSEASLALLTAMSEQNTQSLADISSRDVAVTGRVDALHRDFTTRSGELGALQESVRHLQNELPKVGMRSIGYRLNKMIDAIGGFYSTRPGVALEIGFAGYLTCYTVRMLSKKFYLLNLAPGIGLIRSFEKVFAGHIGAVVCAALPTIVIPSVDFFNSVLESYASHALSGDVKASLVQLVTDKRFIIGTAATFMTFLVAYHRKKLSIFITFIA